MRQTLICAIFVGLVASGFGAPQYLHDVVRQAHAMKLLPARSVVEKTAPGIQVAYYKIGPYQRADLQSALGGAIPYDVLRSLEHQVDSIGKYGSPPHRRHPNHY